MTLEEKISLVSALCKEKDSRTITAFLKIAGDKIIRLAYPYDHGVTEVPERYETLQCEAAAYLLDKRGGLYDMTHSENGVSITYETANLPNSMVKEITPVCGATK